MYPNLYIFLVGPPGTGKTVALHGALPLLLRSRAVMVAPNDVTKQGLLDALLNAQRAFTYNGRLSDFHYLTLSISELSNFMANYDIDLAGILTDLYDCPPVNEEWKRSHGEPKLINNPGLSFIIGTATQNLGNTISPEMWGSGFMARVIIVFSSEEIVPLDMFAEAELNPVSDAELIDGLKKIAALTGPFDWSPEAKAIFNTFRLTSRNEPAIHNRLAHYHTRRWFHLGKLAMTAALSDFTLSLTEAHINTAISWLLEAETFMPEVFKDMISHEDGAIYEELHRAFFNWQMKTRRTVPHALLVQWLSKRVASHQVGRIIQIACSADIFRRVVGTSGDDAEYKVMPPDGSKPGAI
jgi:hypothetical protein